MGWLPWQLTPCVLMCLLPCALGFLSLSTSDLSPQTGCYWSPAPEREMEALDEAQMR